jgi:hypothetical protein
MKKIALIVLFASTLLSCKKSSIIRYSSEGVITGYDPRVCPFCGGLYITIKNDTTKNAPPFYDVNSDLQQLGIDPKAKFPINVTLDWKHDTVFNGNYIIISRIKVIN